MEVELTVGKPSRTDTLYGIFPSIVDRYKNHETGSLNCEFAQDTLNGFIYNNSCDEFTIGYDQKKINDLQVNDTTRSQVVAMLGNNYSEVSYPSNLLTERFGRNNLSAIPATAKHCLIYDMIGPAKENMRSARELTAELFVFDAKGTLVYKFFAEYIPGYQTTDPSPFSPSMTIQYSIKRTEMVSLVLFDKNGNVIDTLVNQIKPAGMFKCFPRNMSNYPSGPYVYKFSTMDTTYYQKIMILK